MDENVCRICLQVSEEEEMTSIFESDANNTIISNKIKSCCGVELPIESDGFPTKICSKCKIFLTIAYKLRTICQNSDAYLRRFKAKDSEENDENEEMQLKRETEVTDKCEENIDSKSIISQTSFPDIQEETGEEFITSLFDFNADIKTEIQIERVENEENPYTECSNEIETKTCDQYIITSCDPIPPEASLQPPPALKLKPKEKKYGICPYCGDRYALSSLSLHIRRHTGEKPYKCDMCDKAFVELHDLKRHKRMHTGEKPHVCATCGKAFSQQNKLARHNLVHTGERPYKCEHCDKAFTQRNELNLHIRRHTGFKPYTCGICGECFLTGTFLRNHQKSTSHFEEDKQDRFIKIRVTNPSRSYRNRGCKNSKKPTV